MKQDPPLLFRDDPDELRYVAELDGQIVAACYYRRRDNRWFLVHTEVEPDYEGRGVGTALVRHVLDEIRGNGGVVVPICPFVRAFIRREPDYQDVIDVEVWERVKKGWEAAGR